MESSEPVAHTEVDASKEKEMARAARRQEREDLRERNQEILVENTQVLFDNLSKYLQGELKGTMRYHNFAHWRFPSH